MKTGKLAMTGAMVLALALGVMPVQGKEVKTDTAPEMYRTVQEMGQALASYPAVKKLALDPYKSEAEEGTYVIPGLNRSASLNLSGKPASCRTMTPQGITETDKYLLISAYCHDHIHHSVIWVLDKQTHDYVRTVVLEGMPHTGSIAWDRNRNVIWVATHEHGKATASAFPAEVLDTATEQKAVAWDRTFELEGLPVDSCLCMDGDYLVAGSFEKTGDVHIRWYEVDDKGLHGGEEKIHPGASRKFGANLQGIAVVDDHILTAASDGPNLASTLSVFPKDMKDLDKASAVVTLPPRLEQISVSLSGSRLYANFESAASAYRDEGVVVDRILSLDLDKVLREAA